MINHSRSISEIQIVRYDDAYREQWDDFVDSSDNGTIFHTRQFIEYHPTTRFEDYSLLFFKSHKLISVLPAAVVSDEAGRSLSSHPGTSFGGFVLSPHFKLDDIQSIINTVKDHGRMQKLDAFDLKLTPSVYGCSLRNEPEFSLYSFDHEARHDLTHVLFLNHRDRNWQRSYSASFKRSIKKAKKLGVTVSESDDIATYYQLLKDHLTEKHQTAPTHSLNELNDLRRRLPGRIRLLAAFYQGRMIAGILLFVCHARGLLAFYIAHQIEFQHVRPLNLLTDEACRWASQHGFLFFDFGTSTIQGVPNYGLIRFREAAGAQGILRTRLRVKL